MNTHYLNYAGASQATKVGNRIEVSGQVALCEDGSIIDPADVRGQAEQCFRNIAAVLEAAGSNLGDVTSLTCYLTDADQFSSYAAVKNGLFTTDPPASTTVVVAALLGPSFLMEVAATAHVRTINEQEPE